MWPCTNPIFIWRKNPCSALNTGLMLKVIIRNNWAMNALGFRLGAGDFLTFEASCGSSPAANCANGLQPESPIRIRSAGP